VALRLPRPLEARLRADAATQQRTMTDIIVYALAFAWEHAGAVEELAQTRKALRQVEQQYARLQKRIEALCAQVTADKKERARLVEERDRAYAMACFAQERLTVFTAANPDLAEANAERYARVQEASWRRKMAAVREERARVMESTGQAGAKRVSVRELMKIAHPDKWEGKPATDLAHEVVVFCNR
jgi:chromosome segregation ATPase